MSCSGTKSGERLISMVHDDALADVERECNWKSVRPALACLIAEIFKGYVTHIDNTDQDGFYFVSTDGDTGAYFKFSDCLSTDYWLHQIQSGVVFCSKLQNGKHVVECRIHDDKYEVQAFAEDKYIQTAQALALIKALVHAKRQGMRVV